MTQRIDRGTITNLIKGGPSPMKTEIELAQAICDGELELLCPQMQLVRCPSYKEIVLEGSGIIRTDQDGRLYFRLVAPHCKPHRVLRGGRPHGELYGPDDHVMLRATDHNGNQWRSDWMLIHLTFPGRQNWIVRHFLGSLQSNETHPHEFIGSEIRAIIATTAHVPFDLATESKETTGDGVVAEGWSLDHHIHNIGNSEITFREYERRWLTVKATQKDPFSPEWLGLILHGLEFSTARAMRPAVVVREFGNHSDLSIWSGPFKQFRSLLPPPNPEVGKVAVPSFWRLVEDFFVYVQSVQAETRSVLLDNLEEIRSGAVTSIETACLTIAIAIEAIARQLLPHTKIDSGLGPELRTHVKIT